MKELKVMTYQKILTQKIQMNRVIKRSFLKRDQWINHRVHYMIQNGKSLIEFISLHNF
jgi:hypothetical protein